MHFSGSQSGTWVPRVWWAAILSLCRREELQASLSGLAVRTEGEKEAKLFLTLT